MYYNDRKPLFRNLYNIRELVASIATAELTEIEHDYKGNLTSVRLELPLEMRGLKHLCVILLGAWEPTEGKGFFCDIDYRASATIGDTRARQIQDALTEQFTAFELNTEQPEGLYENYGSYRYDKHVCLVKRISTVDLVPLYTYQYERSNETATVYRMGAVLVERRKYSSDFIDENGERYRLMRSISAIEDKHGFLLCVSKYRTGHVTYSDASNDMKERIEIHNECILSQAPKLPLGTVLFDEEEQRYAKLIEHEGEFHLQYESSNHRGTYEPFLLSDRFVVTEGMAFEMPAVGLYYDTHECLLYKAISRRPHYMVVELVDRNPFPKRTWNAPDTRVGVVPMSHIVELEADYQVLTQSGVTAFQNTELGEVVTDLFTRTRTIMEQQVFFWLGLAIEHYGSLEQACHGVYFELVGQMRHTSANTEEVKAFLEKLIVPKLVQVHVSEAKSA
ncbi:hypothetical protein [Alicyclobacillus ferrooxydans]|uniref:Uncharacterized protein n=1 Tax=Alicyclobacillus ferrooxydans TaxID=471514 RepID=A0A0N8PNW7_9BACL|nr:hypothetical protein [Alicyclobacillus ferrooxydans]KPV42677.1 hypothetical protein AN477_16220 [Alicyclobacillus ferrooxydans]